MMGASEPAADGVEAPGGFSGPRDGLRASLGVMRDRRVFLQIAAPWALVLAAYLPLYRMSDEDWRVLLNLLGMTFFLAALLLAAPTVAVRWHRWTIQQSRPRRVIALPDWATLRYAWLLAAFLFFNIIIGLVAGRATAWIARRGTSWMGGDASFEIAFAAALLAGTAVAILFFMMLSRGFLRFPALAVGDTDFSPEPENGMDGPLVRDLRLTREIPIGLTLSFAPCFTLGLAITLLGANRASGASPGQFDLLSMAVIAVGLLLILAAVASAAGCLSEAYLATKAVLARQAAQWPDLGGEDEDEDEDEDE